MQTHLKKTTAIKLIIPWIFAIKIFNVKLIKANTLILILVQMSIKPKSSSLHDIPLKPCNPYLRGSDKTKRERERVI